MNKIFALSWFVGGFVGWIIGVSLGAVVLKHYGKGVK